MATELLEQLEQKVHEFGDGEMVLPDVFQDWWYKVDSVDFDFANQRYKLTPES